MYLIIEYLEKNLLVFKVDDMINNVVFIGGEEGGFDGI